jgi:hypothetical protein
MSCPRGYIKRKSFKRKSGTKVRSSCVPDTGKPGKTPLSKQILPKFSGKLHLRKYGYTTKKSATQRRNSLKKASKQVGKTRVIRHLNLARNYTAPELPAYKILSADVKYLKMQ